MEPNQEQPQQTVSNEMKDQRMFAVLGYILPILFFLPLLNDKLKNVPYSRFHANQQVLLLIVWMVFQFVLSHALMMFMYLMFLMDLVYLALLALVIYGAYYAYKGEMRELPFIGHFRLL